GFNDHTVNKPKVNNVDAQLGVNHIAKGFFDVCHTDWCTCVTGHGVSLDGCEQWLMPCSCASTLAPVDARVSLSADHPNNAHLIRAGNLDTPVNALASPRRSSLSSAEASSTGNPLPRVSMSSRNTSATCST